MLCGVAGGNPREVSLRARGYRPEGRTMVVVFFARRGAFTLGGVSGRSSWRRQRRVADRVHTLRSTQGIKSRQAVRYPAGVGFGREHLGVRGGRGVVRCHFGGGGWWQLPAPGGSVSATVPGVSRWIVWCYLLTWFTMIIPKRSPLWGVRSSITNLGVRK